MVGSKRTRELVIAAGLRLLPVLDRLLMHFSMVGEHQIIPNVQFPWTAHLAENWRPIRDEAQALLGDPMSVPSIRDLSPDHYKIAQDDKSAFLFWGYGLRAEANCARCPQTARLLEQIPGLLTALYSVMLAGAHVPSHTGPTKAILTAHMGLVLPLRRQDCHMRVGDHDVVWEEGRIVIFDDMFPHEVWNGTDQDRIILMLHVKRPLRFPGSLIRDLLFAVLRASPFVRDGLRNLERWGRHSPSPAP